MHQVQRRLITYCTNIHPGESWAETFASLAAHVPRIKAAVSPEHPFPIGLRLSARAARELAEGHRASFAGWLRERDCFVPTINGFPIGAFHGGAVKERVYLPDWRSRERAGYTMLLATLLADWLPQHACGSISSLPVGFKEHLGAGWHLPVRENLLAVLQHLERLFQERGADIVLALEPEPGCLLETVSDLLQFLDLMNLPHPLRSRIGICLDCCHLALQFEEPAEVASLLAGAGIRIGKVQVSSALRQRHDRREALVRFQEPCYLHQVVVRRRDGALSQYHDLSQALEWHRGEADEEWRCHFHIPLFVEQTGAFRTTRFFAEQLLPLLDRRLLLEIETYTWQVLPPEMSTGEVADSIIREIGWLREKTDETDRRP